MIPEEFSKFIAERLKTREAKVIKKKAMEVKAPPEFVKLFKDSKFISCILELWINLFYLGEKGKSHMLIRSIKKRSRDEFEAVQEKIEKEMWDAEREKMVMQIENLKDKVSRMGHMEQAYLSDRDKLYNLFDKGIIDESGVPIIHRDESDMKI